MTRKLAAGDIIEADCTKCRAVFNHTIVAMVGERVVRVQCNTCGGIHNYRNREKAASAQRTTTSRATAAKAPAAARKPKTDPHAAEREEWQAQVPSMDESRAISYDMNAAYRPNDIVQHPVFGLGLVKGIVGPQKMEVLFSEGKKLLRCK